MVKIGDTEAKKIFDSVQRLSEEYGISLAKLIGIVNDTKKQLVDITNEESNPFGKTTDTEKKILEDLLKNYPAVYEEMKGKIHFDDNYIYFNLLNKDLRFPRKLLNGNYTHKDALKKVESIGARLLTKEEFTAMIYMLPNKYDIRIKLKIIRNIFGIDKEGQTGFWSSDINEEGGGYCHDLAFGGEGSPFVLHAECAILHTFD